MDWEFVCLCDLCEKEIELDLGEEQYLLGEYCVCEECFEKEQ